MERRESTEISGLLSVGFLSDQLLLAFDLNEPSAVRAAEPHALESLDAILQALARVVEQPSRLLSSEGDAFAFPPTEHATLGLMRAKSSQSDRNETAKAIGRLKKIVQALLKGAPGSDQDVAELKSFLEHLAGSSLEEVDNRRMRTEAGRTEPQTLVYGQSD